MSRSANLDKLQSDLHPPLTRHDGFVEADRCYFCFDAPCVKACPTGIDIPLFIRQIKTDNPKGAATTIFNENIFGGMCARVCPTESLCEEKCVRNVGEDKPVLIGQLQRYATDIMMATNTQPFKRAAELGSKVAIVGAGPAGISCAHRLARYGHEVTVYDANEKPGGLNEYGIAAYKTIDEFASKELEYILSIGGIEIKANTSLGKDIFLEQLKTDFGAVFLAIGLGSVNDMGVANTDIPGVEDAVKFIARLRQAKDLSSIQSGLGRNVVVVGGGMTAIDAAIQSKLLGAENVTVVYRRDQSQMNASGFEQELAQKNGVLLKSNLQPTEFLGDGNHLTGVRFEYTDSSGGELVGTGEQLDIDCDQAYIAIGQSIIPDELWGATVELNNGRIKVDEERRTTDSFIWAGGDCIDGGDDLTVSAVQDGKLAAESIHTFLEQAHG